MDDSIFAGASPWQMWGNTQLVQLQANAFTTPNLFEKQISLLRVQYNRPETWRFLFAAHIVSGGAATGPGENAQLAIWFELFTGIGRSAIKIPFWITLPIFNWSGGSAVPANLVEWTNQAATSDVATSFTDETPQVVTRGQVFSDEIVGQDITVVAHVNYTTDVVAAPPINVEVSGQFAPNVHIRPDWLRVDGEMAEQFTGGELKGR